MYVDESNRLVLYRVPKKYSEMWHLKNYSTKNWKGMCTMKSFCYIENCMNKPNHVYLFIDKYWNEHISFGNNLWTKKKLFHLQIEYIYFNSRYLALLHGLWWTSAHRWYFHLQLRLVGRGFPPTIRVI